MFVGAIEGMHYLDEAEISFKDSGYDRFSGREFDFTKENPEPHLRKRMILNSALDEYYQASKGVVGDSEAAVGYEFFEWIADQAICQKSGYKDISQF